MLVELKDRKGELSRKIGAAKKAGLPIDDLLSEMKLVSSQLKALVSETKQKPSLKNSNNKQSVEPQLPQLFRSPEIKNSKQKTEVTVKLCQGSEQTIWNEYVRHHASASIYHYWEFKEIVEHSFGHATYYIAAFDQSNRIVGVLPLIQIKSKLFGNYLASIPFFNYGGVIANDACVERKLLEYMLDNARRLEVEHVELRYTRILDEEFEVKTNKVSMILELPEAIDTLWENIGTKIRAQIKKARRFELSMSVGSIELLDDFYTVFSTNMRDLGTPVYSKQFFENILLNVKHGRCQVGVVYSHGKPVSCCFLIGYNDTLEIPWASTLVRANAMNANMFMYWNILEHAIQWEYSFFDFGRSSSDASTFRFKKQWGAKPYQQYWYYWIAGGGKLPELNPNNPKYRLLIGVWKKLPLWIANFIGPHVVKYLP